MPSRIDNLDHCAHKAFTSCDCKATSSHGGFSAFSSSLLTMKLISGSLPCASFNPCFVHGNKFPASLVATFCPCSARRPSFRTTFFLRMIDSLQHSLRCSKQQLLSVVQSNHPPYSLHPIRQCLLAVLLQ